MPNIELVGFGATVSSESTLLEDFAAFAEKVDATSKRIFELVEGAEYAQDVVVTTSVSGCEDKNQKHMPFLRVWATKQAEVDDIVRRLDELDIDIELPPLLKDFIPRRSVRQEALDKLKHLQPVSGTDPEFQYPKRDRSEDHTPGNHID